MYIIKKPELVENQRTSNLTSSFCFTKGQLHGQDPNQCKQKLEALI
jgi:hypothetical protein